MSLHRTVFSFLAGLAILASSTARADFTISIVDEENGYSNTFSDDDGFFDTNDITGEFAFQASRLNDELANANSNFRFVNLGGSSNATGTNIQSAILSLAGNLTRIAAGSGSITITLLETAFNLPNDNLPGILSSAASQTFGNNGPEGERTFESIFDGTVSTPVLTFALTTPPPNNTSSGGNGTNVALNGQFSLSNVTRITLDGLNSTIEFTGRSEVTAVPEPASMAMLLLGGSALALRLRGRKLS